MTTQFIISQVLMAISFGIILYAFQVQEGRKFRILFVIASLLAGTHFVLLGTMTAATMAFLNGVRWFTSLFSRDRFLIYIFILLIIILSFYTYISWVSLLPVAAGILGTVAAFETREVRTRQILFGATSLWILNNILVVTPVGIISEISILISNIIGYRALKRSQ